MQMAESEATHTIARHQLAHSLGIPIEPVEWTEALHGMRLNIEEVWSAADAVQVGHVATHIVSREIYSRWWPMWPYRFPDRPQPDDLVVAKAYRRKILGFAEQPMAWRYPFLPPTLDPAAPLTVPEAMAWAAALEASAADDVIGFRHDALAGDLIAPKRIRDWIERAAREAGPFTWWLDDVPVPAASAPSCNPSTAENDVVEVRGRNLAEHARMRFLRYWSGDTVDELWNLVLIPVTLGSPLDRLRQLSERLALTHGWQVQQATTFILSGLVPKLYPALATLVADHDDPRSDARPRRIVLTLDPRLSPREVAEIYRKARADAIGSGRRVRELDEKHLRLGLAALEKRSRTWKALMEAWNAQWQNLHPVWCYQSDWLFSRDAKFARAHLSGALKDTLDIWNDEEVLGEQAVE